MVSPGADGPQYSDICEPIVAGAWTDVNILFVHQNFPGQFAHVAPALAARGHRVIALSITGRDLPGVTVLRYRPDPPATCTSVGLARDLETKIVRGTACLRAMAKLNSDGFLPDVIVAHPGWGDALFCKDVWPRAKLVIYAEFYYSSDGSDYGFDKEFHQDSLGARASLRLKNTVHLHAFAQADVIFSPTEWQRDQLPAPYREKSHVMFDGIDTTVARPDDSVKLTLARQGIRLAKGDEIITFVNRNLEPYRGFHIFMRSLVPLLAARPSARCLIVGRDEVSYGSRPPGGGGWRVHMLKELGAGIPMDRVHFLGGLPYEQYLKVLQISACHVYLTYPFVLSWSCLEAMSVACPLVASDTGPVREVVRDGENGLLVDFFNPQQIAEKVGALLSDPVRGKELGIQARRTVVERFDLRSRCLEGQIQIILSATSVSPSASAGN